MVTPTCDISTGARRIREETPIPDRKTERWPVPGQQQLLCLPSTRRWLLHLRQQPPRDCHLTLMLRQPPWAAVAPPHLTRRTASEPSQQYPASQRSGVVRSAAGLTSTIRIALHFDIDKRADSALRQSRVTSEAWRHATSSTRWRTHTRSHTCTHNTHAHTSTICVVGTQQHHWL